MSLIVTMNLPFAEWPATFAGDEGLTHRVHTVETKGDGYRLKLSTKTTEQGTRS